MFACNLQEFLVALLSTLPIVIINRDSLQRILQNITIMYFWLLHRPTVHWPRHTLSELFMKCACVGALCGQLSPVVDVILCIYLYIK